MIALECCGCHLPYSVRGSRRKALCPYCDAYGGIEIAADVACQLILRPAHMLRKAVRRKAGTPYRSRARVG